MTKLHMSICRRCWDHNLFQDFILSRIDDQHLRRVAVEHHQDAVFADGLA